MNRFDETFDFVTVGSGGGSLCASLWMQSVGRRSLVLEKTAFVGGTTARSGGVMWIPNNPFMRRDGVDDSFEKASAYLDGLIGDASDAPGAVRARRDVYLREGPRMVDFLLGQGVRLTRVGYWPDYYDECPGGVEEGRTVVAELFDSNELGMWKSKLASGFLRMPATLEEMLQLPHLKQSWKARAILVRIGLRAVGALLTGRRWISAGAALQGHMLLAALQGGVDIRTDSPVSELIVDDGVVRGVVTTKDGHPWRVKAGLGVLVNAGGFSHNQSLRDRYQPGTSSAWTNCAPGDTGEMILEMMRHGAAIAQMEEMVGYQTTLYPGSVAAPVKPSAQRLTAAPHAVLVDQTGLRYMNEGGSYMAYCKGMLQRHKVAAAVPSWAIFDSQFTGKYLLAGTVPSARKLRKWNEAGYLKTADSIAALSRMIAVPEDALTGTIDRFNRFSRNGIDEDFGRGHRAYDRWLGDPFHKPCAALGTIEKPPFYAVPIVPGDVGTYGGVVTDEHARVLRDDGSAILGLYATGTSTASVMGRVYPGPGCSVGPACVWGYVAAKHAAASGLQAAHSG